MKLKNVNELFPSYTYIFYFEFINNKNDSYLTYIS